MLDRDRVLEAFQTAIEELGDQPSKASFTKIADRAREIFCRDLVGGEKKPSIGTFRSFLFGRRAKAEIMALVTQAQVSKMPSLQMNRLMTSFRSAVEDGLKQHGEKLRPRTVAVLAHKIYCESLPEKEKRPSLVSFTRRVTGKSSDPAIIALLQEAGVSTERHAKLNREKLREAFSECIKKFENRILRGIARPIHVADSAHRIYVEGLDDSEQKPSRLTFRRMIYGQDADPEIVSLLEPHFPIKR